eukprot:GILK01014818.1.p3 GENE.GILK01014818.1~~GILK01014818.1.p3  ORF type:complete len:101 (-),score=10.32 GILK01014818.1:827-1129(-)
MILCAKTTCAYPSKDMCVMDSLPRRSCVQQASDATKPMPPTSLEVVFELVRRTRRVLVMQNVEMAPSVRTINVYQLKAILVVVLSPPSNVPQATHVSLDR